MDDYNLGVVESRFAEIIWQHEPIGSGELVKRSNQELGWKKATTYTVLRKLCERGIFQNQNSVVSSVISREKFAGMQCESFVDEKFDGSLPAFVNAFTRQRRLTPEEVAELSRLIESYSEE
ncbi:MAG: BlaI/MecI/CopY family transcriptional regulator [Lachnospiraceae bacterium]|nr:BlaI/MecI/CopY family transcriptional regulator [Lachnospiraceae bacterium]